MIKNKTTTLSPPEIALQFGHSAIQKNAVPSLRMWVLSLLGGAFIAVGCMLAIMVAGGMPGMGATNPGLVKFTFGAVFPLGLVLVLIGGAELFTSDCAVMSYGLLNKQINLKRLARLWAISYLGNFAGALIVLSLFVYGAGTLQAEPWLGFSIQIGEGKTSSSFLTIFLKGVGANWLVCMAVWMAYAAKDISGKVLALWFPVMAFVSLGFEHSIANMFFIPAAMMLGADIGMYDFLLGNLLPATLGNIVGGVVLVALPYWFVFSCNKNIRPENDNAFRPSSRFDELPKLDNHLN